MLDSYKLPKKLRRSVEKEVESSEIIRWIEQPIPYVLTRSVVGTCLILLVSSGFFAFVGFGTYGQVRSVGRSLYEFPEIMGILIPLVIVGIQLILVLLIPFLTWLEATQTVYVITSQRALILTVGFSTVVTSFIPAELRVLVRREHRNGSGDVIVYVHRSKDYDGDTQTQEFGFKQVRNAKAFEKRLLQLRA